MRGSKLKQNTSPRPLFTKKGKSGAGDISTSSLTVIVVFPISVKSLSIAVIHKRLVIYAQSYFGVM
jgi:hypothetical protein